MLSVHLIAILYHVLSIFQPINFRFVFISLHSAIELHDNIAKQKDAVGAAHHPHFLCLHVMDDETGRNPRQIRNGVSQTPPITKNCKKQTTRKDSYRVVCRRILFLEQTRNFLFCFFTTIYFCCVRTRRRTFQEAGGRMTCPSFISGFTSCGTTRNGSSSVLTAFISSWCRTLCETRV